VRPIWQCWLFACEAAWVPGVDSAETDRLSEELTFTATYNAVNDDSIRLQRRSVNY